MPKKSEADKAHKSHKPQMADSRGQDHAQKQGRSGPHDNREDHPKKNRDIKRTIDREEDDTADKIGKLDNSKKPKNGCLPKLFMLFLPIMVTGAYFFLRS